MVKFKLLFFKHTYINSLFLIAIYKIELVDNLEYEKFDLRGAQLESIFVGSLYFKHREYKAHCNVPVVISVLYQAYSSSVKFLIAVNGESSTQEPNVEIAEPLTLMRF